MEESGTVVRRHDYSRASRKAEESALRRYQASHWLECLVGPLGISSQPSEREFISCLRNGLVLCKLMNKIKPGSVPKVVVNQSAPNSQPWDSQPLPAYQYFENLRNFLAAIEALNLPVFDASIFERETVQDGSSNKVIDCILALKAYHEWLQTTGDDNGTYKPLPNPFFVHLTGRNYTTSVALKPSDGCSGESDDDKQIIQGSSFIVEAIAQHLVDAKENLHKDTVDYFQSGKVDVEFLGRIFSTCLEQQIKNKYLENCGTCLNNGECKHCNLFALQEKELVNLKALLTSTKKDFEDMQAQIENDFKQLGNKLKEMSYAAQKYHNVVKENRSLYNTVQELKGNIRVYCRIRPAVSVSAQTVIDISGEDGTLVIGDPFRIHTDGRKCFQFNHVFGPNATQDDVFKETQPLIRSLMDGYNVCILAYGQSGSGKTHTMRGPSCGSTSERGVSYLALNDIFRLLYERENIIKYDMHVQMVEVYNEQVRDLLAQDSSLTLPNASMHRVTSTTDVIRLMNLGEANRAVGSHSVLTIHVHGEDLSGGRTPLHSCLHLMDLAGSEIVDKSLSCLQEVIMAVAQKKSQIPYKNSKLTLLLQNALGGHAKILIFAHVSPEVDSFGDTMSTLKFAQRISTVVLGAELKSEMESLRDSSSNAKEEKVNYDYRKRPKTPPLSIQPRVRRLSSEGPSNEQVVAEKPDFSANGSSSTTTHGTRYHIKKSLMSIGKFINGSERRTCKTQHKLTQVQKDAAKSPISSDERETRRQSLVGVLPSQSSRRSSLGGAEGNRSSRTPPDFRASSRRLCATGAEGNRSSRTPPPDLRASSSSRTKRWI